LVQGKIKEEEVDSFNLPAYYMSPEELEATVDGNGCFSIERMEELPLIAMGELGSLPKAQIITSSLRATTEGLIKAHFGEAILNVSFTEFESQTNFFALLKRRATD